MIVDALMELLKKFLILILEQFPSAIPLPHWGEEFFDILRVGLYFFPADVLVAVLLNVFACSISLILWSFVEWLYKKVPGVD